MLQINYYQFNSCIWQSSIHSVLVIKGVFGLEVVGEWKVEVVGEWKVEGVGEWKCEESAEKVEGVWIERC